MKHEVTAIMHNGDKYRKLYNSKGEAMADVKRLEGLPTEIDIKLISDGNL